MKTREETGDDTKEDTECAKEDDQEEVQHSSFLCFPDAVCWFCCFEEKPAGGCIVEKSCPDGDGVSFCELMGAGGCIGDFDSVFSVGAGESER